VYVYAGQHPVRAKAFQTEALYEKQNKKYTEWIEKKFEVTYIKVSDEFSQCNFTHKEWMK